MPATRRCGGSAKPPTMSGNGKCAAVPKTALAVQNASRTAKEVPGKGNSLAERSPTIAAEWHPTLNGDLTPADVSFSKKAKAWWLCAGCGHEWQAIIGNRVRWPGCPHCGRNGRKRPAKDVSAVSSIGGQKPARKRPPIPKVLPGRSFAERFPDTAAEWHPTLNDELTPDQVGYASNRRAWWLCSRCAHQWSAIINSRGKGAGYPDCKRRTTGQKHAVPKAGRSLADSGHLSTCVISSRDTIRRPSVWRVRTEAARLRC